MPFWWGRSSAALFGRSALATQDRVAERYKVFTSALSAVESQYVEKVESDRVVYSAIQGMLQTLDPHSNFLDPRTYLQLRERQEGRYYGLGITIQVLDGDITVVSLFEGSPAYQRGIRRGDVIARIKGEDTKGWTSDKAVSQLRGPKGSTVDISLRRKGYDQLINLGGRARRDQHPDDSGRVHDGRADRLRPAARLLRDDRPRPGPRHRDAARPRA